MSPAGKIAKDRRWKAGKNRMAKVDAFLESLITFNKEKIDQSNIDTLKPYLKNNKFSEKCIKSKPIAAGPFSKRYRTELIEEKWMLYLKDPTTGLPMSENIDLLDILTNSAGIAQWNNKGLPTGCVSLEDATIVS
ncbi:hypothetical protein H9P43_000721 [Blastocladiella emersonii ATCC 22665]|nr:hypothetical protein H9P43_000721 [Blastocladiella emersonii ATCC 22665]